MNHPLQLEFDLKQHTPIVHFQYDHTGATLRATEVKPKLDLFLMKTLLSENAEFDVQKDLKQQFSEFVKSDKLSYYGWVQSSSSQKVALDYKMSIIDNTEPNRKQINTRITLITDPDHATVMSTDLKLKIFCRRQSLRDFIRKHLEAFFVLHNFGTRQNKGWGGFTLKETTLERFRLILKNSARACFERKKIQDAHPVSGSWEKQIKFDHQRLKSGLNHPSFSKLLQNGNGYEKSRVFEYFNKKTKKGWDKKFIKKEIEKSNFRYPLYENSARAKKENNESTEYYYIRALLGVAEHYEFQIDYNGQSDRQKKYKVKIDGGNIERFKSPLTFKVFKDTIFLVVEEIHPDLYNATFNFSLGTRTKGTDRKERDDPNFIGLKPIKTPTNKSMFDLAEFISNYSGVLDYKPL